MEGPSVRERLRYKDISWLMPSVDVPTVLDKLGVDHEGVRGGEIRGFCPDHHLYTGRQPSHPYWTVNVETGETYCFTEGRGSNLVWIVRRLLECRRADDAAKFLAGATSAAMGDLELAHEVWDDDEGEFRTVFVHGYFAGYSGESGLYYEVYSVETEDLEDIN